MSFPLSRKVAVSMLVLLAVTSVSPLWAVEHADREAPVQPSWLVRLTSWIADVFALTVPTDSSASHGGASAKTTGPVKPGLLNHCTPPDGDANAAIDPSGSNCPD